MVKLPKNLIRKYGISKKAWSIFRGAKKKVKTGGIKPMTRKRSRKTSRFFKRSKRSGKKDGSGNLMGLIIGAGVYGVGREYLATAIQPITEKIPLGGYADEVVLGVGGYMLAKGKIINTPFTRNLGKAILVIEAARIGSGVASGMIGSNSSSNDNQGWN